MNKDTIILSMTTWPPRYKDAMEAMYRIVEQRDADRLRDDVHCVLVLSKEECKENVREANELKAYMDWLGVEVIYDSGNIRSHKKLIPTIEQYPDYPVLVVDDDGLQAEHWLSTFVADHRKHPTDIIYGMSLSRVFLFDGKIVDDYGNIPHTIQIPGEVSTDKKPASGASGTLYPAHTFTDPRFFDRKLMMRLSPTSDEVWSFAFAKMARRTFRCLSQCNYPQIMDSNQDVALFKVNYGHYNEIHNAIAQEFPEYVESLKTEL